MSRSSLLPRVPINIDSSILKDQFACVPTDTNKSGVNALLYLILSLVGFIPKQDTDSSSFRASVTMKGFLERSTS